MMRNAKTPNMPLPDEATLAKRADTLNFGPAVDLTADLAWRLGRRVSVLDCGCAGGHFSRMLASAGVDCDYIGLDFSLSALIKGGRRYGPMQLVNGDAFALPFAQGVFDVCFANDIMYLFDPYEPAVKELFRVGRRLVIVEHHLAPLGGNSLKMRLDSDREFSRLDNFEHCHDLFRESGLGQPDLAMHWEVPAQYPTYQGVPYRFRSTFVWNQRKTEDA